MCSMLQGVLLQLNLRKVLDTAVYQANFQSRITVPSASDSDKKGKLFQQGT